MDLLAPLASLPEPQWEGLNCSYVRSVKPPPHLIAEETEDHGWGRWLSRVTGSRGLLVPGPLPPIGLHCEGIWAQFLWAGKPPS